MRTLSTNRRHVIRSGGTYREIDAVGDPGAAEYDRVLRHFARDNHYEPLGELDLAPPASARNKLNHSIETNALNYDFGSLEVS